MLYTSKERRREREREREGRPCLYLALYARQCTQVARLYPILYALHSTLYALRSVLYTLCFILYNILYSLCTLYHYRMGTPPRSHLLRYVRGLESTVTTRPRNSICPEAARVELYSTRKLDAFSVCLCTVAESAESPALVSYEMSSIKINKRLLPAASAC